MQRDFKNLNAVLDSRDGFTVNGHQVKWIRTHKKTIPAWAYDDVAIQKILLAAFPKLAINQKQRDQAGRWLRVIHLYFRLGYTARLVARDLNHEGYADSIPQRKRLRRRRLHIGPVPRRATPGAVKSIVQSIRRVAAGYMSNGRRENGEFVPRGRPRGRPKAVKLPVSANSSSDSALQAGK